MKNPTYSTPTYASLTVAGSCSSFYRWDTGEKERMSPWDMEPIPDSGKFYANINNNILKKLKIQINLCVRSVYVKFLHC